MAANRLDYLDVAKGIGIILVVFAHVNYTKELLVLIYSFHMPLFFLISGMLFKRDRYPDFASFFKRRLKTLFLPYAIYALASIAVLYLAERAYAPLELFDVSASQYIGYLSQILISNWSGVHVNSPLWFIPCLLLVEALYFFISKLKTRAIIPICILLACCGWFMESEMLPFDNTALPWSMDSALFALSFYATGNLSAPFVKERIQRVKASEHKTKICILAVLACAVVWLPLAVMNGKITLGSKVLNNGILLYVNGILGSLIVLAISVILEKSRFLLYCGRNSFDIMASHYLIRKYAIVPIYVLLFGQAYDKELVSQTIIPFIAVFCLTLAYTLLLGKAKAFWKQRAASPARTLAR